LGGSIFAGSLLSIAGLWAFYFNNRDSLTAVLASVFGIAVMTSFLHELEHDLIHNLYFKKSIMQDVMFFFIWLSKLHGNP
jgi:fatty acid desaturase